MKKWEEQQKNKIYQQKIKNAKPALLSINKSGKLNKSLNDSKHISQLRSPNNIYYQEKQISINDYYYNEKQNILQIPLYKLLKMFNLQQYAKELITRGFGYDLTKFRNLTQNQIETLFTDIKVLPGHNTKLNNLLIYINEITPIVEQNDFQHFKSGTNNTNKQRQDERKKSITKINSQKNMLIKTQTKLIKKKSSQQFSQNLICKNTQINKQNKLQHIGFDYFVDENNDSYNEFKQTLENLLNKYTINNDEQANNANNKTLKKKDQTNVKDINQRRVYDDLYLISQYDENNNLVLKNKENRLIKNLQKQQSTIQVIFFFLKKKQSQKKQNNQNESNPQLEYEQIKHMYVSYEGGKLTSTLINLDIEELCYCLSCIILKYIQQGETMKKQQESYIEQQSQFYNQHQYKKEISLNKTVNMIEEPTLIQVKKKKKKYLKIKKLFTKIERNKFNKQQKQKNILKKIKIRVLIKIRIQQKMENMVGKHAKTIHIQNQNYNKKMIQTKCLVENISNKVEKKSNQYSRSHF
ncbi:n-terminal domain protein [Ichthyophthirius multifiliis]|uniref:N-terminal domain protein n=1 Tax=Ichthyophthirius multifiliis TaxID=5932 RepID=G0R370_ICHMU|nr:n-terminal domain protein [Ichthyophthirius multifiliis]EGR28093.1 n-terminal domain protein [Ichthyophthirius multifiliis]|eukprot:XP_004027438.1 n-terminal domain protein [Ichthyophthirius multifiliis]